MIELLVTNNRIAQFAAKFEPYEDGYVFYGANRLGGLPCSAVEREYYIENFAKVLRTGTRVMFVWIFCAALGLVIAEEYGRIPTSMWIRGVAFLIPFPWVLWTWWRSAHIVLDDIGKRVPLTPPRSYKAGVVSRVVAFPRALPVAMIGIGAVLLVQQWRYGVVRSDFMGDLIGIGVIVFGGWILWLKFASRATFRG